MKNSKSLYHGHRFPAEVISCAVRWYFRFQLSLRDIEEVLFERGVIVTYETIRCWCDKFGKGFAHRVKAARRKLEVAHGTLELVLFKEERPDVAGPAKAVRIYELSALQSKAGI
ncbi:IS element transposase [Caballeronia sordidicola]|uniref:IS element transposase n=1 Tax=Caballeronia sordidicola TaxID=196367 RepID=A0A158I0X9_CABSO|nr:IS element transposase [Caballeronia sordidicola]